MDRRVTILPATGAAFLLYAGASLTWSLDPQAGAVQLISLCAAFACGYFLKDIRKVIHLYLWFMLINLLLVLAPSNPWADLTFGLFGNANYLGCAMALGIAAAIAYRFWTFIPICLGGLIYSQSRGAILAAAVVTFLALPWRFKALSLIGALAAFAFSSSAHRGLESFWARLGVWESTLTNLTFWGHGWGSFHEGFKALPVKINMTLVLPQHAYNDFFELLYDLGIGAVPLWIFLIVLLERQGPEKLMTKTFLLLSLTFFPLYLFGLGQLLALTLGHSSRKEIQWQGSALKASTI